MTTNKKVKGHKEVTAITAKNVEELLQWYVKASGFTGGLNVQFEGWTVAQPGRIYCWPKEVAVSPPFHGSSSALRMAEANHEITVTEIAPLLYIATIPFANLKRLVIREALHGRLLTRKAG